MISIFYIGVMALLWISNLFRDTGLDSIWHITTYTSYITYAVAVLVILLKIRSAYFKVDIADFIAIVVMIFFFVGQSFLSGNGADVFNYLWAFVLVWILSQYPIEKYTLKYISIIFAVLGLIILLIYDYGTQLGGWNSNSIGMIGMHSYLIFLIPFYNTNTMRDKVMLIIVTILYFFLLYPTDSRSSLWVTVIAVLFALSIFTGFIFVKNKVRLFLWLFIPLLVAFFVVNISDLKIMEVLNTWSVEQFEKPFFNGRDEIWKDGFRQISEKLFGGFGYIYQGYWHNIAIAVLYSFGVFGFISWISVIYRILRKSLNYVKDKIVLGGVVSFLLLYFQQSVELGMFSTPPNILPYIILGIILGRIKYIKSEGYYFAEN